MRPIEIDVIAPIPEGWGLCTTCEAFIAQADIIQKPIDRGQESLPPDWMEEYQKLSRLIMELSVQYQKQILIRIYDPRSIQGMFKAFQNFSFRYPTFIVRGFGKVNGYFPAQIHQLLTSAGCMKVEN